MVLKSNIITRASKKSKKSGKVLAKTSKKVKKSLNQTFMMSNEALTKAIGSVPKTF